MNGVIVTLFVAWTILLVGTLCSILNYAGVL